MISDLFFAHGWMFWVLAPLFACWVLALILQLLLSAVWVDAFVRHARSGTPIAQT